MMSLSVVRGVWKPPYRLLVFFKDAGPNVFNKDKKVGYGGRAPDYAHVHFCVCTFGPVFCIIVSACTCMIMEFKLVDGVQFFLVLSVLVALPPLW